MNSQQEQSEYSMWAVLGSPLVFNADLRKLDPQSKHYQAAWAANLRRIVCNPEMLAVNQDPLGKQGVRARSEGDISLYQKPLADGSVVLPLLNRAATPGKIRVSASDTGLPGDLKIRDLWMRRGPGLAARLARLLSEAPRNPGSPLRPSEAVRASGRPWLPTSPARRG